MPIDVARDAIDTDDHVLSPCDADPNGFYLELGAEWSLDGGASWFTQYAVDGPEIYTDFDGAGGVRCSSVSSSQPEPTFVVVTPPVAEETQAMLRLSEWRSVYDASAGVTGNVKFGSVTRTLTLKPTARKIDDLFLSFSPFYDNIYYGIVNQPTLQENGAFEFWPPNCSDGADSPNVALDLSLDNGDSWEIGSFSMPEDLSGAEFTWSCNAGSHFVVRFPAVDEPKPALLKMTEYAHYSDSRGASGETIETGSTTVPITIQPTSVEVNDIAVGDPGVYSGIKTVVSLTRSSIPDMTSTLPPGYYLSSFQSGEACDPDADALYRRIFGEWSLDGGLSWEPPRVPSCEVNLPNGPGWYFSVPEVEDVTLALLRVREQDFPDRQDTIPVTIKPISLQIDAVGVGDPGVFSKIATVVSLTQTGIPTSGYPVGSCSRLHTAGHRLRP